MTREEMKNLLNKLIEIEEKNDIGNLTRSERAEFQLWINEIIEQEPKTGHWIKTPRTVMGEGYMWYCDQCNHEVYSSRDYPSEKHCPQCGAKMEGEDKE